METSMMNDRQPQATVDSTLTDRATHPELLFIDLDLLDDNPYQPRAERDELKSAQLRESIANRGQLQPILVRKAGARWQIIFGHGRVEALRRLRDDAKAEADRLRFSRVRAEERSDVSDEQMLLLGLLENIQREDISPVDCSDALFRLRSLRPDLDTIEAIARETGMEPPKVQRLLRLQVAPQVIKDAVSKGKTFLVPVGAEQYADPRLEDVKLPDRDQVKEVRKLDLSSALSLTRLYVHWCESPPDQAASSGGTPDERMAALIDRVLAQEWGVRRVRAEVAKLAGNQVSSAIDESPGNTDEHKNAKGTVPFKVNPKKVVIFTSRLARMNNSQKAELKSVLRPIWDQLGGEIQPQPTEDREPLHWIRQLPQLRREWKLAAQECRKLWRIFLVYVVGKAPLPADQLPSSYQLPSDIGQPANGGQLPPHANQPARNAGSSPSPAHHRSTLQRQSEAKPVAPLSTGTPQGGAKTGVGNGSEHPLST